MSGAKITISLMEVGAGRPGYCLGENIKRISEVSEMFFTVVTQEDSLVKIHQAGPLISVYSIIFMLYLNFLKFVLKTFPRWFSCAAKVGNDCHTQL